MEPSRAQGVAPAVPKAWRTPRGGAGEGRGEGNLISLGPEHPGGGWGEISNKRDGCCCRGAHAENEVVLETRGAPTSRDERSPPGFRPLGPPRSRCPPASQHPAPAGAASRTPARSHPRPPPTAPGAPQPPAHNTPGSRPGEAAGPGPGRPVPSRPLPSRDDGKCSLRRARGRAGNYSPPAAGVRRLPSAPQPPAPEVAGGARAVRGARRLQHPPRPPGRKG